MMLRSFSIILLSTVAVNCHAQNLVPNWSFEEFDDCPNSPDEIFTADHWSSFRITPDLFSTCADVNSWAAIPDNLYFDGSCEPLDGSSYGGYGHVFFPILSSEVMAVELEEALEIETEYYVSFFVRRRTRDNKNCWSNKVAAKFTTQAYSDWPLEETMPVNNNADVLFESSVKSMDTWTKVDGWFLADSAYTHLAIGNMFDPELLEVECDQEYFSYQVYYHVDCVCVSESEEHCNNLISAVEPNALETTVLYPNPVPSEFRLETDYQGLLQVMIYNSTGQLVQEDRIENDIPVDVSLLPTGIYQLRLISDDQSIYSIPFAKE